MRNGVEAGAHVAVYMFRLDAQGQGGRGQYRLIKQCQTEGRTDVAWIFVRDFLGNDRCGRGGGNRVPVGAAPGDGAPGGSAFQW